MEAKDPYENLKKELNNIGNWPQVYMFKFIVRADNKSIALIESNSLMNPLKPGRNQPMENTSASQSRK